MRWGDQMLQFTNIQELSLESWAKWSKYVYKLSHELMTESSFGTDTAR